ncbi:MAG: SH3 domain-containing protein [Thermomicrobiales bacterium]|nr:SH3 domain-containing protein [Thermomicrobiales bacterium]
MRFHPIAVVAIAGLLLGGSAAAQTPPPSGGDSAYADLVRGAPGLVAYWRFDETSGTTAHDAVAGGPEGTYAPATGLGAPGLLGDDPNTAIRLDGSGDAFVDMGDALDFPGAAPFTLETWIAIDDFAAAYPRVIQKEGVDDRDRRQGYLIYLNKETGRLGFERWEDGHPDVVTTPDPAPTGEPVHIVAVYDGTAMRLYVNGAEVSQAPAERQLIDNSFNFRVGVRSDGDSPFSGIVDEVAIYDQALDAETIAAHYDAGKGGSAQFDAPVTPAGSAAAPAVAATPAAALATPAAPAPTQPAVSRAVTTATEAPAAAATEAPAATQAVRVITVAEPTAAPIVEEVPAAEPTAAPAVEEEPATEPTAAPTVATATTTDELNLRAGPTTDTVILNEIPAGTEIELTGKVVDGFVSVIYEGRAGWVASDFLDFGAAGPPASEP